MSGSWKAKEFPNLKDSDYIETSESTEDYNCIAWAAHDTSKRWDPDDMDQYYWPPNAPRNQTMLAFIKAFQSIGYESCLNSSVEEGFEKIAIYALHGKPTHAARQLKNGLWTSKLGDYEDIQHQNLECLNGDGHDTYGHPICYGQPEFYMRRRLKESESPT